MTTDSWTFEVAGSRSAVRTRRTTGGGAIKSPRRLPDKSSELDDSNPPGPTLLDVEFFTLPRHVESRPLWQSTVAEAWQHRPALSAGVFVDVNLSTSRSLEGLLKPIIDGLTPCLGRDPRAWLEFTRNDHLIQWLRFHRTSGPTLRLRLGRTM